MPKTQTLLEDLTNWLVQEGLDGTPFDTLIDQLCARLVAGGMPLLRSNISMRAQHPEVGAFAYRWKRKTGMIHEEYVRDPSIVTGWDASPLKFLIDQGMPEMRCKIPAKPPFQFPMFAELAAQGATDYFAMQLPFQERKDHPDYGVGDWNTGVLLSWSADGPGFSDGDLDVLRGVLRPLGLALKSNSNHKMAEDLLAAYLGADAGGRVMSGEFTRGSLQKIEAVIFYFDLSGFTKLSEALDGEAVIELLNAYYGAAVPIIEARGGNVLKFMGDGLLAIFAKGDGRNAEENAVETIREIETGFEALDVSRAEAGLTTTGFTVALHAGEVLYGNIGSASRLDFTVIGPAVNTTARFSGMTANVDQRIVIGADVARPLLNQRTDLVSLGQYRLRGVSDRQELFTLD